MKKIIVPILLLLTLLALTIAFPELRSARPNFLFLLVVFYSFRSSNKEFLIIAFAAGMLLDIFSGIYFGSYTIAFLSVSIIINYLTRSFFKSESSLQFVSIAIPVAYLLFVGISVFANTIAVLLHATSHSISPAYFQIKIWIDIILNLIFALPVFYILQHLADWVEPLPRKEQRYG